MQGGGLDGPPLSLYTEDMTNTDRPSRFDLAREAWDDFLAERFCPLHAEEVVLHESDDHVVIGCLAEGCEVRPVTAGAF